MILRRKNQSVLAYDFDAVYMAHVEEAKAKLARVFAYKLKSQSSEDAAQNAYIALQARFKADPADFKDKTKTKSQWIAYFISSALNLTTNEINLAINRVMQAHDIDALVDDPATRSLKGLQTEHNFDYFSDLDVYERKLALIEKGIYAEKDPVKKEVLIDWFLNHMSQREISQKHNIVGGTVSSIVSRFKDSMFSFFMFVNMDQLVENNDVSMDEIREEALERQKQDKIAQKEQKKEQKKEEKQQQSKTESKEQAEKQETRGRKKKPIHPVI